MPKKVDIRNRISVRSVGLFQRQIEFIDKHNLNFSEFVREAIDKEILYRDPKYLNENDEKKSE